MPDTALIIHAKIKPDAVADAEAAARSVFAVVERDAPPDFRWAATKLADGVTFLIILQMEPETGNPLHAIPEYQAFVKDLREWSDGPSQAGPAEIVGSYRLFT